MAPSTWLTFQAVDIGIGSFAIVSARAAAGEDGVLVVDKPIFQLNQHVQRFYKIKEPKTKIPCKKNFVLLCSTAQPQYFALC